jgi:hypothetical protein
MISWLSGCSARLGVTVTLEERDSSQVPGPRGGRQVSITWRYNSGGNANCGQTVVKRYPLKSCASVFCLLS